VSGLVAEVDIPTSNTIGTVDSTNVSESLKTETVTVNNKYMIATVLS